jgi:hypothetical protein
MAKIKYTREVLEPVVRESVSFAEVIRRLGLQWSGGTQKNIVARVNEYGIDFRHFLGRRANSGSRYKGGLQKRHFSTVLVKREDGRRTRAVWLRRAMLEAGFKHVCSECTLGPVWRGKPLVLTVDHKNGDFQDSRPENVRFLCPNCHSQTETFSRRRS